MAWRAPVGHPEVDRTKRAGRPGRISARASPVGYTHGGARCLGCVCLGGVYDGSYSFYPLTQVLSVFGVGWIYYIPTIFFRKGSKSHQVNTRGFIILAVFFWGG